MKNFNYIFALSTICILSGCILPVNPDSPVAGAPASASVSPQPKFEREQFIPYNPDAVDPTPQNTSYVMGEAMQKAVVEVKRKYPSLFRQHNSFVVGAFVEAKNIRKSQKIGRISADALTFAIGKTAKAFDIRYKRNMLTVKNNILAINKYGADFVKSLGATAAVTGTYIVRNDGVYLQIAFYDVNTLAMIAEHDFVLPMTPKIKELSDEI